MYETVSKPAASELHLTEVDPTSARSPGKSWFGFSSIISIISTTSFSCCQPLVQISYFIRITLTLFF